MCMAVNQSAARVNGSHVLLFWDQPQAKKYENNMLAASAGLFPICAARVAAFEHRVCESSATQAGDISKVTVYPVFIAELDMATRVIVFPKSPDNNDQGFAPQTWSIRDRNRHGAGRAGPQAGPCCGDHGRGHIRQRRTPRPRSGPWHDGGDERGSPDAAHAGAADLSPRKGHGAIGRFRAAMAGTFTHGMKPSHRTGKHRRIVICVDTLYFC